MEEDFLNFEEVRTFSELVYTYAEFFGITQYSVGKIRRYSSNYCEILGKKYMDPKKNFSAA
jgi:hypothetical protein